MSESFLDKIVKSTRDRVSAKKSVTDTALLRESAARSRSEREPNAFRSALAQNGRINIIAEFKRASPSKGVIIDNVDVTKQAELYALSGASAISILTEEHFFKGSLDDLKAVRTAVQLPLLRKDFTVDTFQIYEAAAAGADAILLIVAILSAQELREFSGIARSLAMDSLVEVHTADELDIASECGAEIIGVNNRNLQTFDVSLDVSRELIKRRPDDVLMIAESGISTREQIDELKSLGFNGFLVGESLMRGGSLATLKQLAR